MLGVDILTESSFHELYVFIVSDIKIYKTRQELKNDWYLIVKRFIASFRFLIC